MHEPCRRSSHGHTLQRTGDVMGYAPAGVSNAGRGLETETVEADMLIPPGTQGAGSSTSGAGQRQKAIRW